MSERDWAEIERLRLRVLALENEGMETAVQLGEAEAERDRYREALLKIAAGWRESNPTVARIARVALDG